MKSDIPDQHFPAQELLNMFFIDDIAKFIVDFSMTQKINAIIKMQLKSFTETNLRELISGIQYELCVND